MMANEKARKKSPLYEAKAKEDAAWMAL